MSLYIKELGAKLLTGNHGLKAEVHVGEKELLVELTLGSRKQAVGVSMGMCKSIKEPLLRLRSRACRYKIIRLCAMRLRANGGLELGALCLDTSINPPVIDVVYNIFAKDLRFEEFLRAMLTVAQQADRIESRRVGSDTF